MLYKSSLCPLLAITLAVSITGGIFYKRVSMGGFEPYAEYNSVEGAATEKSTLLTFSSIAALKSRLHKHEQEIKSVEENLGSTEKETIAESSLRSVSSVNSNLFPVLSAPWQVRECDSDTNTLAIYKDIKIKQYITISASLIRAVGVGERFEFNLPGARPYIVEVDEVKTLVDGDRTWFGHIDTEEHGHFPVTFTSDSNAVYATITTPEGSYSIESSEGRGLLYRNPEAQTGNDIGREDTLIPADKLAESGWSS